MSKYGEEFLTLHRKIMNEVELMTEANGLLLVSNLCKKLDNDSRTIVFHLKLIEMAHFGHFVEDGKVFMRCNNA